MVSSPAALVKLDLNQLINWFYSLILFGWIKKQNHQPERLRMIRRCLAALLVLWLGLTPVTVLSASIPQTDELWSQTAAWQVYGALGWIEEQVLVEVFV